MTKIKICGLRRAEDMVAVNRWRPDYAGFVFAPSKRRVTAADAAAMSRQLDKTICPVGVYVNADPAEIIEAVEQQIIRMVQLHGQETPEYLEQLKRQLPPDVPVIKAIGMAAGTEAEAAGWQQSSADYLLYDGARAGSGQVFDHNLIEQNGRLIKPWFLAGGISTDNVSDLIKRLNPWGVDVSSGVETDGDKDPKKIEVLIRRVRNE